MRISDWSSDVCSSDLSFCALQANRGQAATVICARVDSNTVGVLVHFQHDRVAMHHDLAFVRLPRRQELVTDPAQILRLLLCQWNARLNALMDEGINADSAPVLETIQKINMDTGYVIEQTTRNFITSTS